MRVALVHDYLNQYGGGERVLEALSTLFPQAPIYTLFYDEKRTGYAFAKKDVRTSFLQNLPRIKGAHHFFPLLMPIAVESFDFSEYDLVISDSASYAKGIITGTNTFHLCYCHTPTRYLWQDSADYTADSRYPYLLKFGIPAAASYLRLWDRQAAQRPDAILANSRFVQKRIKKYYGRESQIVYPPVNFNSFASGVAPEEGRSVLKNEGQTPVSLRGSDPRSAKDYFLIVGRLVPYKRFDIAVEACTRLSIPLKIIGRGPSYNHLRKIAGPTIEFVGLVSENILPEYYRNAKALLFPQEEDFGITALESMASGKPVIAYGKGGALEIIEEGKTGIFFSEQTPDSLVGAIESFNTTTFDSSEIRKFAEQYDIKYFLHNIMEEINKHLVVS